MPLTYDRQEDFYKSYWLKIEELLRPSDNVENFIVQYLIAKLKTNDAYGKKVATKMLYDLFKLYFDDKCNDVESCFKDMFRYAKFFRRLIFNDDTKFENLSALDKKFYELMYLLDANNAPIILMYLLDRNEREPFGEETFIKFVDALISLTFRAKICKRNGITPQFAGNVLARLDKENFLDENKFWHAIINSSKVTFPNDKDFQTTLMTKELYTTKKSNLCKYLLYSLERAARSRELPSYSTATVEHILPQTLNDDWKNYLTARNDSQTHELWLHTLGNLTLTGENETLGNSDFDTKKNIYTRSNFSYTRTLKDYPEWTSRQIQLRAKKLAAEAIKIWSLPEEFNSKIINIDDTFNLDSDFGTLIGTKPASVFISDTEIKISNWINLVREVVKQFYALDEDIFRQVAQNENLPRKGKLFSSEPQTLQKPFKIAENYYMKNRLSTGECLKMVKTLAENFDKLGGTNFKEDIYFTLRRI